VAIARPAETLGAADVNSPADNQSGGGSPSSTPTRLLISACSRPLRRYAPEDPCPVRPGTSHAPISV